MIRNIRLLKPERAAPIPLYALQHGAPICTSPLIAAATMKRQAGCADANNAFTLSRATRIHAKRHAPAGRAGHWKPGKRNRRAILGATGNRSALDISRYPELRCLNSCVLSGCTLSGASTLPRRNGDGAHTNTTTWNK